MIEHLRKYTGLIIFVIALLFVGLAFLDRPSLRGMGDHDPVVIKIDGRSYTHSEYQKLGRSSMNVAHDLVLYEMLALFDAGFNPDDPEAVKRFFVGRMLVRQACEEFGIHPQDAEVMKAIKSLPKLQIQDPSQGQPGTYNQAGYNNYVKNVLGKYGLLEADLFDVVRDQLALSRLTTILGGGLGSSREFAEQSLASIDQKVTVEVARLPQAKYQETINPTDEELKAEWETTKDKYLTEKKVKIAYLVAVPKYPEKKEEEAPQPEPTTDEEKKAAAEKKAADATAAAEEKRQINKALAEGVDNFISQLNDSGGKDFEKLASANGWEIKTTALFPRSAPPAELDLKLRASGSQKQLADYLFELNGKGDSIDRFTTALAVGDGQWFVARLDETEEARPKEFEEAKDQVRVDYIAKHAGEALKKDADEKVAKLREGLTAGKPFADVAKELGLEPKPYGPFGMNDRLDGEPDSATLFQTAAHLDPGTVADPVIRPNGAILVFVEKREIVKDEKRAERVENSITASEQQQPFQIFAAWLHDKIESTPIESKL